MCCDDFFFYASVVHVEEINIVRLFHEYSFANTVKCILKVQANDIKILIFKDKYNIIVITISIIISIIINH